MENYIIELKQKRNRPYYFAHKKVVIIKIYELAHLVKIRFENTNECMIVDISALSYAPDFTNAISLRIIGG
ncbi:hypothetical protein JMF89_04115 [Clostridiaceae bacterium UIB06]|uniref:Uncharacterized protein n=1 Tax=Clostridium thailandense TaxID=2794346 RepID=A0A949TQY3_9CLOT|nr:hypothetical protein [Clostridium thailandense]MBV7271631.1 hypothetical protein [Clostridium thailandense]MCH5136399.1 hypothetical protein [Clostridiaceae bacterium UIB06]